MRFFSLCLTVALFAAPAFAAPVPKVTLQSDPKCDQPNSSSFGFTAPAETDCEDIMDLTAAEFDTWLQETMQKLYDPDALKALLTPDCSAPYRECTNCMPTATNTKCGLVLSSSDPKRILPAKQVNFTVTKLKSFDGRCVVTGIRTVTGCVYQCTNR